MSASANSKHQGESFTLESRNKFFEVNQSLVDREIRPGRTMTLLSEVDLTQVESIRLQTPFARRPSYTSFVVKAVALALHEFPYANCRICKAGPWGLGGTKVQAFARRDVAVAIEREFPEPEGLVFVNVVRDADELFVDQIHADLQALSKPGATLTPERKTLGDWISRLPSWRSKQRIRSTVDSPEQWVKYRGGAVLVSAPAKQGVNAVLASSSHPIGISFGVVKNRPVVVAGNSVVAKPTFFLSLNFDRRLMSGARASQFFHRIVEILEKADVELKAFLLQDAPPTREDIPVLKEPSEKH